MAAETACIPVEGYCDSRFEPVREAFRSNLERHGDVGASVSVVIDGKPVVDLWGGYADAAKTRPWTRDTIGIVASTTKGLTGIAANMLIDRGQLDPNALVTNYWPEYGQKGKERTLVRHMMDHRAGLPAVGTPEQFMEWGAITRALAEAAPDWEPGTAHSYHGMTYGWLVGELIRRVSGKTPGQFLRDEIAGPLGVDAYIGTPSEKDPQVAEIISDEPALRTILASPQARRAEMPAGNGHTNARALARIYGALARGGEVDGVRLISDSTLRHATSYCVTGPWEGVDNSNPAIGATQATKFAQGFILNSPVTHMGPNPRAFGYAGAGGSASFADPAAKLGFAYMMNRFAEIATQDSRSGRLVDAVYACLQ